jgi:hypothetical protein
MTMPDGFRKFEPSGSGRETQSSPITLTVYPVLRTGSRAEDRADQAFLRIDRFCETVPIADGAKPLAICFRQTLAAL